MIPDIWSFRDPTCVSFNPKVGPTNSSDHHLEIVFPDRVVLYAEMLFWRCMSRTCTPVVMHLPTCFPPGCVLLGLEGKRRAPCILPSHDCDHDLAGPVRSGGPCRRRSNELSFFSPLNRMWIHFQFGISSSLAVMSKSQIKG